MAGINLTLAAPKKQYHNHLAELSWQTISTMACCLLVPARLPDSFMFHALLYSCHIFNVLPVKGLLPMSYFKERSLRLVFSAYLGALLQLESCHPPIHPKLCWKATQRGIRGIFVGFARNQKGYLFYSPASRQLYISGEITFDKAFTSTIATTWRLHRNNLALCPVNSNIPVVTMTLEHTGVVDNFPIS